MTAKNYISTVILIGLFTWAGSAIAGAGTEHNHGDKSAAKSSANEVVVADLDSDSNTDEDGRVMGYASDSYGHAEHVDGAVKGDHAYAHDAHCGGCADKCGKSKCGCKSKCGGCGDKCGKSKCGNKCGDKCGKSKCGDKCGKSKCGDKCGKSKCGDKCGGGCKSKCSGCGDKCGSKSKCGCGGKCGHKSGKGGYDAWGVYQGSR